MSPLSLRLTHKDVPLSQSRHLIITSFKLAVLKLLGNLLLKKKYKKHLKVGRRRGGSW